MIARLWTGVVDVERLSEYVDYVRDTGVAEYRRTPGNLGAWILTRHREDGSAEVLVLSLWRGREDLRAFTGDDVEAMVLYPEDSAYLLTEPTLTHYSVADAPPE
jgi:hypothetical protein